MAVTTITKSSADASNPISKMPSPKDSKAVLGKTEDSKQDRSSEDVKPATNGTNAQPLAPPPKPSQNTSTDTPDYFSSNHNSSHQFSLEPNPFERSFGNPPAETPGGSLLPPVASITSPSPLPGITPGWNSLRAGPLSPAMLAGPTNTTDYFSGEFRSFPTPNESSLRTGLTPGGGGSMFPAPSPNSQHLFQLQGGGATPGTLDFHKTALSAATASTQNKYASNGATSQAQEQNGHGQTSQSQATQASSAQGQPSRQDMYQQHDVHGAANDLLQFATQANGSRGGQFAVPNQAPQHNGGLNNQGQRASDTSPTQRRGTKGSIGTDNTENMSESGQSDAAKPRTRGKKANSKGATGNNRRKAEETPAKGPANKKQKAMNGMPKEEDFDSEDEDQHDDNETGPDGRKMTDEEKRKNFLERNRVAALKCRQRKKQWLANLQAKVELFSTENDALSAQVTQLREEVVNLKTLLLAHKDCPVSQAQGLGGMNMNSFIGDVQHNQNPYGIGMQHGMMMGQPQAMQQRG